MYSRPLVSILALPTLLIVTVSALFAKLFLSFTGLTKNTEPTKECYQKHHAGTARPFFIG